MDVIVALHTGTYSGFWGAVEVAVAVGVLAVAVSLVAALLLEAAERNPEATLVAAFSTAEGSPEDSPGDDERSTLDHRAE